MLLFLKTVNIIGILLMIFMLAVIFRQQPSKVQTAFILYNLFTIVFVVGIHLELIHSDTVGEALSGLCVQYVGQAGLLMSLLWFVSEFSGFFISAWVYRLEAVCNVMVLVGVFTAERHPLFYTSMKILTDGLYNRIEVGHGILWYLHFAHLYLVVIMILILCVVRYKGSTPIQQKRIVYIAVGIGAEAALLLLKIAGVFGSYNPIVIAMTFSMFCMMMAMVRYSYFDSLHAAVDNAFNHGNEGLVILDSADTIIFANRRMDELFPDIRKGSVISRYEEIRELMESDEHLLRRDGDVYELREENIVEQGEINGRMLWFVNQTQQLLALQKLKEADEAKTQFLMKVSHELRTPMNTVLGMNEMILRESHEEAVKHYAKEVADAGTHMMSLIDEVLDASRLESGALTIVRNPYRVGEVIERAEELMRSQAEKKGLIFTVEAAECLTAKKCIQLGDSVHMLQVLVNLLSNAVKYTDTGFVRLKADILEKSKGKWLILSVSDSGIGIQDEELEQIFENFGRGSNTGSRDGLGLGLAIVKQLTEAMGGTLTVESTQGEGSVFSVLFPWIEMTEEAVNGWEHEETGNEEFEVQDRELGFPDFHAKTILAVDDNANNLMVLRHLLKRTGAVVETAEDGQTAVEACRQRKYDLILLDHMMPIMDGIAALHRIREQEDGKNRDTKIIALTANAGKGARQMYRSEGFADYITKPVIPERLEHVLSHYLGTGKETTISDVGERTKVREESNEWPTKDPAENGWLELLERNGIDTRDGLRYADMDAAFYRQLLILFAEQQEMQQGKLDTLRQNIRCQDVPEAGNGGCETPESILAWNAWISFCHGLKGEARGLGASVLGAYFYQLELAGRTKDKGKIEEIYPHANKEWKKVVEGIRLAMEEPLLS